MDEMEELHRIYEQQISHWFYNLLSPEKQQRIIEKTEVKEDILVFSSNIKEADIVWN